MTLRSAYLLLAVVGAVVPYGFFLGFFAEYGFSVPAFLASLFASGAAGGFTADLLISSFVFWLFMFARRAQPPKQGAPAPWLFILLNLTIGLSCALPAYLYAQARRDS
jgi:small-conductance mechanosensitive channel